MKKKRILHLITGLGVGGAEKMLLKTLPKLTEDFEHVVCSITKSHKEVGKMLEEKQIKVVYLDLEGMFDFGIINRFKKVVKEYKPNVLVTYLIHADIFGRIFGRLFGIKKIVSSVRVKPLGELRYIPFYIIERFTSLLVSHYHFNSQSVADYYVKKVYLPRKKVTVIPNGIDVSKFENVKDEESLRLSDFDIDEKDLVLGCVAELRPQKGHVFLLKAIKYLSKNSDFRGKLLLIGDGEERRHLEEMTEKLGIKDRVLFLGRRNDVPQLLSIIDIFVLPTLAEGMSNAIMEAMASRKAVITTDIEENRELIENEETGLLVQVRDWKGLGQKIKELSRDEEKRSRLGAAAYDYVRKNYDIEVIVERLREFYSLV